MNREEQTGLKWSMYSALFHGALGIIFSVLANSQAVLLDGAFNLISAVTAFFSLRIIKMMNEPISEALPVGYVALEPFYVSIRGFILVLLTGYVVVSNIIIMLSGGTNLELGMIVIYLLIAQTGNITTYLIIRRYSRKSESEMLQLEAKNWFINASITSGIAGSFILVYFFRDGFMAPIVPYIDQIIVTVIGLATIRIPYLAFKSGLKELLLLGTRPEWIAKYKEKISNKIDPQEVEAWKVFFIKTGRKLWISLFIKPVKSEIPSDFPDKLKEKVSGEIEGDIPFFTIDVIVTKDLGN